MQTPLPCTVSTACDYNRPRRPAIAAHCPQHDGALPSPDKVMQDCRNHDKSLLDGADVRQFSMADCILYGLFDHAGPSTTVWPRNTCTGRAVPHTARDGAHP